MSVSMHTALTVLGLVAAAAIVYVPVGLWVLRMVRGLAAAAQRARRPEPERIRPARPQPDIALYELPPHHGVAASTDRLAA